MNHIGSRTNEGYHTTSTGTLNGHRFIICASGCRVDIYTEAFQLQQTINISNFSADDSTIVTAVAISSPSGKIAASQGHLVYIFEPHADETEGFFSIGAQYTWVNTSSILHEFDVRCICWGTALKFELFTGGIGINFWNHQKKDDVPTEAWVLVWSTRLANEIHFLECSPEGRFFATFGKDDNLPKIWFSTEQDLKKETLAVPERKPSRSDMIIKKRQSSLPGFSFVYSSSMGSDMKTFLSLPLVKTRWLAFGKSYDAIHWLNPKEVRNLIELRAEHEERLIKSRRKSGTSVKRGKKLMDTVKEYSTMLFFCFIGSIPFHLGCSVSGEILE
ncbi:hypothetical protein BC829DRAFT_414859 [Chytridium lagenaria]|nr:hypothetical protein BC829DRAFT_414859 [Chytridium lagenaria]